MDAIAITALIPAIVCIAGGIWFAMAGATHVALAGYGDARAAADIRVGIAGMLLGIVLFCAGLAGCIRIVA